jgi:hypothetical protein
VFVRFRVFFAAATLTLLVTGCSGQKQSSFSAFQKLPASQLSTFKTELKELPIKNIELPTKLPFTISNVSIVPSIFGMKEDLPVPIHVGGGDHGLAIVAAPDSENTPPTTETTGFRHSKVTKLSDGTKAIYGNNGHESMLVWTKDGVEYTLYSSNSQNKPDLTEEQLIQVADSFR